MDKINFVNKPNTDTPINDKNLNKMQVNIEKEFDGVILYQSDNGSNEKITFENQLLIPPKRIKIYYKDEDDTHSFTEIDNPLEKPIDLHILRINRSYNLRMKYSRVILTLTGIDISDYGRNDNGGLSAKNDIYITKIIAYI